MDIIISVPVIKINQELCPNCDNKFENKEAFLARYSVNKNNSITDFIPLKLNFCAECCSYFIRENVMASCISSSKSISTATNFSSIIKALAVVKIKNLSSRINSTYIIIDGSLGSDKILKLNNALAKTLMGCAKNSAKFFIYNKMAYEICYYYQDNNNGKTQHLKLKSNKYYEEENVDNTTDKKAELITNNKTNKVNKIDKARKEEHDKYLSSATNFCETVHPTINSLEIEFQDINCTINATIQNIYNNTRLNLIFNNPAFLSKLPELVPLKRFLYALCKDTFFIYKNELYNIVSYTFAEKVKIKYLYDENKIIVSESDNKEPFIDYTLSKRETVYVYRGISNFICYNKKHYMISKTLYITPTNTDIKLPVAVDYCKECNKFFIDSNSLKLYKNKYGYDLIDELITIENCTDSADYTDFNSQSELYKHGYNVRTVNNLSESERQNLLKHLIDKRTMQKTAIERDLSRNIYRFQNIEKYSQAIIKWKSDLLYVREYNKSDPEGIGELVQ